ncbi:primosomal protein N' [Thiomicrospira aerophila AL3]|uniref:Replication restart protein PriA n=1 Tax=Thiomicrospira aerophila AL3 TaxID=717772 RepID=W0DTZ3_9GAMM|nr:primosomal protein N' [Thiomicrospira aerophila]AHF01917.1 primosomal protein N' [Thiomicrospira aerophila AL3]
MQTKFLRVQVALPGPFWQPLSYLVPDDSLSVATDPSLQSAWLADWLGWRVRVPFRNQTRIAVVVGVDQDDGVELSKLKPLLVKLDQEPVLNSQDLKFLRWAANYYHEPIGEVVMAALPKRLRDGEPLALPGVMTWQRSALGQSISVDQLSARAHKQRVLWQALSNDQAWSSSQLNASFSGWQPLVKRWVEQGWLAVKEGPCLAHKSLPNPVRHLLNDEQQAAVTSVQASQGFGCFLLDGVTGSGKTEVYLALIEQVLAQGKQVLVLVPEIGLTPQTAARFEAYLQQPVVALHSGLNDQERHCAWQVMRRGEASVLLGTRSALFSPFADLGLCILDEEHDLSFKQQDGFRYSARDLLIRRAHLLNIPVLLGSATPSMESLHNAQTGRYRYLRLSQRAGEAQPPHLSLLDVRGDRLQEGLSNKALGQMREALAAGGQVLVFLNRRGFAPVLLCHSCGWQGACSHCDANLTYHHASDTLKCHHCGFQQPKPKVCPACGSAHFVAMGQGTERLEQFLTIQFPEHTILRIDRDTTRLKGSLAEKVTQARDGEADILIGTQMLAKGHHFPKLTLVVMLDLDQGLFSVDFRGAERMAQLLVQVAGRAGRGTQAGRVLIQTHQPEHPTYQQLLREGYAGFAAQTLGDRQIANLPPFSFQLLVRVEALDSAQAVAFLEAIKALLLAVPVTEPCEVWGPVSAPMAKRQNRWRYQLLLQASSRASLQAWWQAVAAAVYAHPLANRVRWSLDVDPQEMG